MGASRLAFQVNEKEKFRWCYVQEIWGMRGKSDLSLRHHVEDDFGSLAPLLFELR
jgi:hypothetical protein